MSWMFSFFIIVLLGQIAAATPWSSWRRGSTVEPLPANQLRSDILYDFVVVGGGTAGLTVATRLAQHSFKVAIVEAGVRYEDISFASIPAAVVLGTGSDPATQSPIDWGFVTEPFPGSNNRQIHYPRGKCLGGSSALNWMIYQRPSRGAMERWSNLVNDKTYRFNETLPYFQRSINFTAPNPAHRRSNATTHYDPEAFSKNGTGPVSVSYPNYVMPFSTWMQQGLAAVGIADQEKGFNSGYLNGSQYFATTIKPSDSTRSSSDSFLDNLEGLQLTIYDNTMARKILFDQDNHATGVEIIGKHNLTLKARHEVILSAGAIQSPQLLMVSGIGPQATLKEHGIDVLVDAPGVGQNLWDHPFFALSYRVNVETFTGFANQLFTSQFGEPDSPFGSPLADFGGWEKIPPTLRSNFSNATAAELSRLPLDWPEVEYLSGPGFVGNFSNIVENQPSDGYEYASILGSLTSPNSRGNVTLASSDIHDAPVINPNLLSTEPDQELAIALFKRIRQIFESKPMARLVIGAEYSPGKSVQSDEEILAFIKNNIMTIFHPACTCKMGVPEDPMAVVDSKARVISTKKLRVVDASAFPILPPGHPQSTVYMLAEKISDDIIREYLR